MKSLRAFRDKSITSITPSIAIGLDKPTVIVGVHIRFYKMFIQIL